MKKCNNTIKKKAINEKMQINIKKLLLFYLILLNDHLYFHRNLFEL